MALHIIESDSYETLKGIFVVKTRASLANLRDPFTRLDVIVDSLAVADDLKKAITDSIGCDPGVHFHYLAQWFWRLMQKVNPELISDTGIDGASLAWRVFAYLKDDAFVRTYPRLVQATSSMSDTSRFSLAERIARVLLTYNAFRNDWVIAWLNGEDPKCEQKILTDPDYAWQKAMWQKIGQDLKLPLEHPARRLWQTPEAFRETSELHVLMPQNVAPFYLEFLAELSRVRDITIYVINPSEIYWFDLNRKTVIEEGSHPILSKWAAQRKALNQLLIDFTYAQDREDVSLEQVPFRKEEPFGKQPSNLEWLQHSIFKGNAKLFENFHEPRRVVDGSPVYDRSLEIHGAYSLKREIEAFVDYLYDIFQNDETLKASDVLVLTPALEKAAPLFESVFTNLPEKRKIAWRVVGRSETARNELVTTLFQLFETILGGFGVREVYTLFSAVPVAARFRFTNETLDKIRTLFEEAGFHQSLNREELAQKSFYNGKRFTLEAALNRVMLRYVMREDFDDVVGDIRPEGRRIDKEPLAALYRAFEVLTDLFEVSTQKRTLSEWVTRFLQNALANFMQGRSEDEIRVNEVADLIMKECETGEAHNLAIDFSTFVAIFKNKFKAYTFGAKPVPSVTLTNLANMRGLPYRVIAVIGLNDGVFPRRTEAESFDLCLAAPKAGDRQRNADDKNVFFDVLTAARDYLYLSYTSRDMANGTRLQPSSLIRELLECLTNQNATTKDDWLIEHPIQAFSAANFYRGEAFEENDVDIRKISFDTELADDINVCQGKPAVFNIVEEAQSEEIALSDVLDFWDNPLKYFWKRRLGLNMARDDSSFTNDEPLTLSELDKWKINTDIFDELMESGQNGKASDKSRLLAASIVPSGKLGEKAVDDLCSKVEAFAALCRTDLEKGPSHKIAISKKTEFEGKSYRVTGTVELNGLNLMRFYAKTLKWRHVLKALMEFAALDECNVIILLRGLKIGKGFKQKRKTSFWLSEQTFLPEEELFHILMRPYLQSRTRPVFIHPDYFAFELYRQHRPDFEAELLQNIEKEFTQDAYVRRLSEVHSSWAYREKIRKETEDFLYDCGDAIKKAVQEDPASIYPEIESKNEFD